MSFLKKVDVSAAEGPHGLYISSGMLEQMPALVEYLAVEKFPDGSPRERASLLVIIESGALKVCLSDRANQRTLWRTGPSLEDCLLSVELALASDTADWRRSAAKGSYGGTGKKK